MWSVSMSVMVNVGLDALSSFTRYIRRRGRTVRTGQPQSQSIHDERCLSLVASYGEELTQAVPSRESSQNQC